MGGDRSGWTRGRFALLAVLSFITLITAAAIPGFGDVNEPARVLLLSLSILGMAGTFGFTGAAIHAARSKDP